MITRTFAVEGRGADPHENLALEQVLLESVGEGECILYLWQNEHTVVIGRNQNPWAECRTALLEQEGGRLARRLSGGGAVYHDLGNLNFTFLMSQGDYDLDRQLTVIQRAVESLGIPTERSGRNDILASGRKFSGNAFYKNGTQAYHHGTLLVDADLEKLGRYLSPSKAKLKSKGVDSVRSRVGNLRELNPAITIEGLKSALWEAFAQVYGGEGKPFPPERIDEERIRTLAERNRSWEWNFGRKMPFSLELEERFPWGGVQLQLQIEQGIIREARVWSDAMGWQFPGELSQRLTGCKFLPEAISKALAPCAGPEARDVEALLLGAVP